MSRGHLALALLFELVEKLDEAPASTQTMLRFTDAWPLVARARTLVAELKDAANSTERLEVPFERDYCAACEAVHPPSSQPEPHGARRTS